VESTKYLSGSLVGRLAWAHFGELRRAWDEQNLDPDDVFFHVQERRQQIKEQIRQLQKGLQRQRPKRKKGKK